jgi:hypothetical protein
MSDNIVGLIRVLIIFGGASLLLGIGYSAYICHKKIKHRNQPLQEVDPFFNIEY